MKKLMNKIQQLPKLIKISEIIFILSLVLYGIMLLDGGLFTSFYALMLMCIIGIVTAVIALFKKYWAISIIHLLLVVTLFVSYICLA